MASAADYVSKGLGYVLPGYSSEGAPPGVAGAATAGQPVVFDPGTGLYVNQATGAVSTDAGGQHPVQNPSLATQAANNIAVSNQFLSTLGEYGQQYRTAQAGENNLAAHLNDTIAGRAPSVAQSQLEQGLGQIEQQQLATASGATGEGGALARQNAMANIAAQQAAVNQQKAGVRAQEVQGAEQELGGVLGNQAGQALEATGQGETAAGNFAQLGGGEEGNRESLVQSGGKNQLTTLGNIAGAAGQAGATISDEDAKDNIKPADMEDFMSKLHAITFNYKNPEEDGEGARVGVKAQDVKKSKVGKGVVVGKKPMKLDNGNAMGAALASIADLHHRLKKVEARG